MSDFYRDGYAARCPFCGGTEMIECFQSGYAAISSTQNKLGGRTLYHSVCRKCGSIVRSYVREPEKLLKKKDRKTVE
ncbi:MAG: hypothetical protein IK085_00700 [Clostridia bacterium]|nr:hypothetical protein [Clostridia bacterium]